MNSVVKSVAPGLALCSLLSLVSYLSLLLLAEYLPAIGPVLLALLLGIFLRNTTGIRESCRAGVEFAIIVCLPLSIVLLGARIHLKDLLSIGLNGLALTTFTIILVFLLFLLAKRFLNLSKDLYLLLATGTAICGGTAVLALAPILGAKKSDIVFAVTCVAAVGLSLMIVLPVFGYAIGLGHYDFGMIAGLSIHQTPQVVAAGFSYGQEAGEIATVVKLARICLLAPILLIIGLFQRGTQKIEARRTPRLVPLFLYGFVLFATLRTLGLLPVLQLSGAIELDTVQLASAASKLLMTVSMAALGLDTGLTQLRETGGAAFVASCTVSVVSIAIVTGLIVSI